MSGSHLYGFPSQDSDVDLRGVHVAPAHLVLGIEPWRETHEDSEYRDGRVYDEVVTHDIAKFARLLLKNNGYVLEQVFSPWIISTSDAHDALKLIAHECLTRNHGKHYLGFSQNEWNQFHRRPEKTVKRLLYVFRVLLTGINLMRTGEIECNINQLNKVFEMPFIDDLIEQKINGLEHGELPAGHGIDYYTRQYDGMVDVLDAAMRTSNLPEEPPRQARAALNAFVIEQRLVSAEAAS